MPSRFETRLLPVTLPPERNGAVLLWLLSVRLYNACGVGMSNTVLCAFTPATQTSGVILCELIHTLRNSPAKWRRVMAEILEREDVSVYVVAGVPRSFKKKLKELVEREAKSAGDVYLVNEELTEWLLIRLKEDKRPSAQRTPASRALWRAFSALSAARYYLEDESEQEEQVRELRRHVENLWREVSPMFDGEGEISSP